MMLREQLPAFRARGLLAPYLIEDTTAGTILGGANLRLFDPMRDTVELGYWLFVEARGRGVATRVVRALAERPPRSTAAPTSSSSAFRSPTPSPTTR